VGICDTPTELFHRIALALHAPPQEVQCDYMGLNHLGWVYRVRLRGEDVMERILADDELLDSLYSAPLFDHEMLRALRLLPTEYLFFYYARRRALENQRHAGTTRGAEVVQLNVELMRILSSQIGSGDSSAALGTYVDYLNQRSGSYMKLEGVSVSAFDMSDIPSDDPFRAATGYHRIALDVMNGLCSNEEVRVVVNVRNSGSIAEIAANDVAEVPCAIGGNSITPEQCGSLPESVRGLVLSVKAYERAIIEAAVTKSASLAQKALLLLPTVGEWEPSGRIVSDLMKSKSVIL